MIPQNAFVSTLFRAKASRNSLARSAFWWLILLNGCNERCEESEKSQRRYCKLADSSADVRAIAARVDSGVSSDG